MRDSLAAWRRFLADGGNVGAIDLGLVTPLAGLEGVTATSPTNAWAVGIPDGGPGHSTGIVHWNGRAWK